MAGVIDSLTTVEGPDRVNYETGVMLNADDFKAEQDYHRGRLARALEYLIGSGTIAGLRVVHEAASEGDEDNPAMEERLMINPGLAMDPLGRMLEVPRHLCIRLSLWFDQQNDQDLRQGWHAAGTLWSDSPAGVVVDVLIQFITCERGKTPAFAAGPFDALDAVTASRLRDSVETSLFIRREPTPPLPENPWPNLADIADGEARTAILRDTIFDAWKTGAPETTSLFIARLVIEATEAVADGRPIRVASNAVAVNNSLRPFVYTAAALARWLGIDLAGGADD